MVHVRERDFGGLGSGLQHFGSVLGKALQQRNENKRFESIFNPQPQQTHNVENDEKFRANFLEMVKNYENETGTPLDPPQIDFLWKNAVSSAQQPSQAPGQPRRYTQRQFAEIARTNPQLASMLQQGQIADEKMDLAREKMDFQERLAERREKMDYLKLNEPEMIKAGDKLERLNEQKMELGRLNELFTTDADKMPSAFTAAMFNYKGEGFMSRLGRATLSPEAQEALKILTSQIKGLNQTFRGRILETEIKYYMRTWPELLNTPEGKMKIMRDIKLMHKVQETVLGQTQKEIGDAGGKISYSEAHRRALRKTTPELENIKKIFIKPEEQAKELSAPPQGMVNMYIPSLGTWKQIPKDKVSEVQAAGGKLIK